MRGAHHDGFDDELPPGRVIGSRAPGGFTRRGADAERHIAIDHGALRIGHLDRPGWGRAAIAYGPFEPAAGLLATVHVLNGHNASDDADLIDRQPGHWHAA